MPVEIIVAAMSLCGTALGSLAGILTSYTYIYSGLQSWKRK